MVTKKLSVPFAMSALAMLAACTDAERAPYATIGEAACVDLDGDGYGLGCGTGTDCDEHDPRMHADCAPCRVPGPGCACSTEGALAACGHNTLSAEGELSCTQGVLTCRDGRFSACRAQQTVTRPASEFLRYRALIDRDAALDDCDPCDKDCYRVTDPLDQLPPNPGNIGLADGGGITIVPEEPPVVLPPCVPGAPPDGDCDGIPEPYDSDPTVPATNNGHQAVFMGLPPGTSFSSDVSTNNASESADVYFYLDMSTDVYDETTLPDPSTLSPDPDGVLQFPFEYDLDPVRPMGALKNALYAGLETGNFLPDPNTPCANGDDSLRSGGVAGNIACLIPGARFGAGWFRDIPFGGPLSNGYPVAAGRTFMFGHALDMTTSRAALAESLSHFTTSELIVSSTDIYYGNLPEGGTQGLWSLATGGELYAGWSRPGIPARVGCPAGTFGYACFRQNTTPLVFHLTDAPMQNGPRRGLNDGPYTGRGCLDDFSTATCNPLDYPSAVTASPTASQQLLAGTDATYLQLSAGETITTAEPVGEVTDRLVTYVGTTTGRSADVVRSGTVTCSTGWAWHYTNQGAPDVVFAFRVTNPVDIDGQRVPLVISARGSEFDATLMVVSANGSFLPTGSGPCADDTIGGSRLPEIETTLPNGNYLAILKGYEPGPGNDGRFQFTIGNPSLATVAPFAARPWSGTNGVESALSARDMRVVGLCASRTGDCSADNPYTAEQSELLARSTGALAADGSALAFSLDPYGTPEQIGRVIVAAAQAFVDGRTNDVTLRWVQAPDDPTPDFGFVVEARAVAGCQPPVDTNSDGLPDTHVACAPSARPEFTVTFSNPAAPSVPPNPNPARPGGGYEMRLELVSSTGSVLDVVPVYILPQAATGIPLPVVYRGSAVYEQTVYSPACLANEAPLWRELDWDAELPDGTELDWEVCAAPNETELASCTFSPLAHITRGSACTTNADCTDGFCDDSGYCHFIEGRACSADAECRDSRLGPVEVDADAGVLTLDAAELRAGRCVDHGGGGRCAWGQSAVPLAPALPLTSQGLALTRLRLTLRANASLTDAPIVNHYDVEYTCAPLR